MIILNKVNQKDKYHMISLHVESKICHKLTYLHIKQTHRHRDQTCGSQGGGGRGMDWESGVGRCKYYI